MAEIKCIGIVTSGNDAPGMNCAIRAVTRSAIYSGLRVKAIYRGYKGLIDGEIVEFQTQNVSNIIQQGGTILKSSPSKSFLTAEGREKAYERKRVLTPLLSLEEMVRSQVHVSLHKNMMFHALVFLLL